MDGITAAAVGALTGSLIVIANRNSIDVPVIMIAVSAIFLYFT
jgi:chromate transporter